jgi:hypothetical protein
MLRQFIVLVVVAFAAVVLSACSGNVADHKANCAEYDKNFVKNPDGSSASPVSCEKIAEKAQQAIDASRKARLEGVCYDIAAQNSAGSKPIIVSAGDKGMAYKWVGAFGQGYQDCGTPAPYAYFEQLFAEGKVIPGK